MEVYGAKPEYLHGHNGAVVGVGNQAGWIGLAANLVQLYGFLDSQQLLMAGRSEAFKQEGKGS
jgi:hypothetical protein